MAVNSLMIHTCDIQRPSLVTTGRYHQAVPAFAPLATNVLCRLDEMSSRGGQSDRALDEAAHMYKIYLPGETDITSRDQIVNVVTREETFAGPFLIRSILKPHGRSRSHIEVVATLSE